MCLQDVLQSPQGLQQVQVTRKSPVWQKTGGKSGSPYIPPGPGTEGRGGGPGKKSRAAGSGVMEKALFPVKLKALRVLSLGTTLTGQTEEYFLFNIPYIWAKKSCNVQKFEVNK